MPMPNATVATTTSDVFVEERVLIAMAIVVVQAGVIRHGAHAGLGEPRRQRVDFAPRLAVDDAGLAPDGAPARPAAASSDVDRASTR